PTRRSARPTLPPKSSLESIQSHAVKLCPRRLGRQEVPTGLLKRGERIRTTALIEVSAEGLPTRCTVTQSPGPAAIGDHACRLYMARARFKPARDEQRRATPGSYEAVASWEAFETATDAATSKAAGPRAGPDVPMWVTTDDLPRGVLTRDESVISDVTLKISATGKVSECLVLKPGKYPELDVRTCQLILARGNYRPALDASGQAVESETWHRVRWQQP
ncbi:hypothetical protein SAMN06295912_1111, partial [Sphingomonas laterariae]